jgi:hypothetical protein
MTNFEQRGKYFPTMFLTSKPFPLSQFIWFWHFRVSEFIYPVIFFKNEGLHGKVPKKKLFFFRKSCRKFGRSWLVIKAFHDMILISNLWLHISWIINKAKVQRRLLNTSSFLYIGPSEMGHFVTRQISGSGGSASRFRGGDSFPFPRELIPCLLVGALASQNLNLNISYNN